jgi:hypothetical protein
MRRARRRRARRRVPATATGRNTMRRIRRVIHGCFG